MEVMEMILFIFDLRCGRNCVLSNLLSLQVQ
jgi:hypothetical protein